MSGKIEIKVYGDQKIYVDGEWRIQEASQETVDDAFSGVAGYLHRQTLKVADKLMDN